MVSNFGTNGSLSAIVAGERPSEARAYGQDRLQSAGEEGTLVGVKGLEPPTSTV